MPLRFHWSLSPAGDPLRRARDTREMSGLPNLEAQVDLCRRAEDNGIEVATALLEYKPIGISQFLFSGWPDAEEVDRFGRDVLPLVRAFERQEAEVTIG
jgi:hypothetical protein